MLFLRANFLIKFDVYLFTSYADTTNVIVAVKTNIVNLLVYDPR
jgi:hypothetical protein